MSCTSFEMSFKTCTSKAVNPIAYNSMFIDIFNFRCVKIAMVCKRYDLKRYCKLCIGNWDIWTDWIKKKIENITKKIKMSQILRKMVKNQNWID